MKRKIIFLFIMISIIVSSCVKRPLYGSDTTNYSTLTKEYNLTATSTWISATPSENIITTALPLATWTPAPTLSDIEAERMIQSLLKNNGGCRLPCWWGIIPGKTTWEEARQFLSTFATSIVQGSFSQTIIEKIPHFSTNYSIHYKIPGIPDGGAVLISLTDGIVSTIAFGSTSTSESFRLSQLLSKYGKPGKIFVETYQNLPYNPLPFTLVLYYPEFHFLARFETYAQKEGSFLIGCPKMVNPYLVLWSADRNVSDLDIQNWAFGEDSSLVKELKDVTNLSEDEFYRIFRDSESIDCIKTPVEYW